MDFLMGEMWKLDIHVSMCGRVFWHVYVLGHCM